MKKKIAKFTVTNAESFKIKMLNWSARFNIFCFLDNNNYSFEPAAFECMLAAGVQCSVSVDAINGFEQVKIFSSKNPGWLFGHFNYPGTVEKHKTQRNNIGFEAGFFFQPEILLQLKDNFLRIESGSEHPDEIFTAINDQSPVIGRSTSSPINIRSTYTKEAYVDIIQQLKKHIQRGDCYEINFCQDFYAENTMADPLFLYAELASYSPNPFSAFYKLDDKYCMCASPERFLKKTGNVLISQPMKGTSRRSLLDPVTDLQNKNYLIQSEKEKSENVMVVDLVRNDMSKICLEGSVVVKELFGIYSFPQVHQMVSTIEGKVAGDTHWCDIIKACFPMGSMTGAPKKKVMELISQYEITDRGLFSGTIGYVDPDGNFDFNVVIRSMFYNRTKKWLSFSAGGGITFNSNPADEYDESMTKVTAITAVLDKVFTD